VHSADGASEVTEDFLGTSRANEDLQHILAPDRGGSNQDGVSKVTTM